MQNGNISNVVQPRILLVFEGTLGHISKEGVPVFNHFATQGEWYTAWSQWSLDQMMCRMMWDVTKRQGININVVSFVGDKSEDCRMGLQDHLDAHHLPVADILLTDPGLLAREIAFMPDVARIYDGNAETAMMYGNKGTLITHWNQLGK